MAGKNRYCVAYTYGVLIPGSNTSLKLDGGNNVMCLTRKKEKQNRTISKSEKENK